MDRKWKSGAAVSPPALDNVSDGFATAGNPGTGTPATKPGAHMWHMVVEEPLAVIEAAAIAPDKADTTQLLAAVQAMFSGGAVVNGRVVVTHNAVAHTWTVAVKALDGNDASATKPVFVAFRSSTASSAARVMRKITGALSMVISSGSTLGHSSGTNQDVFVYLIDNAGTVELAVSKLSPSDSALSSTRLISTTAEGGAGGADSGTGIYSTTARSNVSWVCIARAISNQVTAGTWDAAPVVTDMLPLPAGGGGAINDAQLSANVALYNASMAAFSSGTLNDARLSANVRTAANSGRVAFGRVSGAGSLSNSLNVTSVTRTGTGSYTIDYTAAGFSSVPACVATVNTNGLGVAIYRLTSPTPSTTQIGVQTYILDAAGNNALTDADFSFECRGT